MCGFCPVREGGLDIKSEGAPGGDSLAIGTVWAAVVGDGGRLRKDL